ncbi:DEAD/DEAH box helicase family protein [Methanolapillus millepedarum]|uniref:DEAD/DEAH box helicase family protein n=1 Tax=Methanolapillus millepedarum TaxID=3028296 RepID=A0AA96V2S8_9EURY|nr:hypothetical protein MsAc7_10160 [Methanosarcinaceae archaeon Ac7]
MKLKFDSNLSFQKEAISAVVDLFEGTPQKQSDFDITFTSGTGAGRVSEYTELGLGNKMFINEETILKNLHAVQERNFIPKSSALAERGGIYKFPNFSVEMETGTGKTYVYLRTIFELNKKYGYKKFVIVVPSVAIREGVSSSIRIMKDHFKGLYDNVPFDSFIYNSKDLNKVRQFAVSNEIQIMIINIQAFQKDAGENEEDYSKLTEEQIKKLNVIHQEQDKMSGRRPIEYIQATRPIVIFDEPQSVDGTPKSKKAVSKLKPLFGLRYSATHKKSESYNVIYKLDPVKAYDLRLVKQIEVASVQIEQNYNKNLLRLVSIGYPKGSKTPQGKAIIYEDTPTGTREKPVSLKHGTDISDQTNRPGYEGYVVTNICAEEGLEHVEFANGKILEVSKEEGGTGDDLLKFQLKQTIEEHFKKEKRFKDKGIKVLSLFFIDKVSNYRVYEEGEPKNGKLAVWFEELYTEISKKQMYQGLLPYKAEEVHNGYFSADVKKGKIVSLKDTSGTTKDDEDTYELIMKDKERLLSTDVPLQFIFSHSALKEGWDNPNVFQICSLREMGTERERRQTIGRGLRLPVNQTGERIFDDTINRLTVIAGESFEKYAAALQEDIEKDMGEDFKFGQIEAIAFSGIVDGKTQKPIGQEKSAEIKTLLEKNGFIDKTGQITGKFKPDKSLDLPPELVHLENEIKKEIKSRIFEGRIKKSDDKKLVKYNKAIELNEDFKVLWEKISKKTRYFVEFKTDHLIQKASENIKNMEDVTGVRAITEKAEVDITKAGVEKGKVKEAKVEFVTGAYPLPDILSFLQRETELTRSTLVEILKKSDRLYNFKSNPQVFMTEVAKLINRAMNELVIDGIKYEIIDGQYYEMRLFDIDEVEKYLDRLYEIQSKDDRTPYNFVEYDSELEHKIAEQLDSDENVKFFCKLPNWFAVPTPVGEYRPDWAIVLENDKKLYLVRETKGSLDEFERRGKENEKLKCGKAHFKALGVDFKVATDIYEVLSEGEKKKL